MRKYLEALEIPPSDAPEDYVPEFIRLDATGRDESLVLRDLKELLSPDKHYVIRRHYCFHDEPSNRPCVVEVIEYV